MKWNVTVTEMLGLRSTTVCSSVNTIVKYKVEIVNNNGQYMLALLIEEIIVCNFHHTLFQTNTTYVVIELFMEYLTTNGPD